MTWHVEKENYTYPPAGHGVAIDDDGNLVPGLRRHRYRGDLPSHIGADILHVGYLV